MKTIMKHIHGLAILLLMVALGLASVSPMHAQAFYGAVVGTVSDATGAVVPGATVMLTNVGTNEKHTATADKAGDYQFVNLVPAVYRVEVDMANFKRYVRDNVTVEVNTTARADAKLQVGATSETVEVSTAGIQLQTDSGTVSNKVEAQQMDELPLVGRNVMQLLSITAGVMTSSATEAGATVAQNGGTSSNPKTFGGGANVYTINGGDNEEFLDGAPINMLQGSNVGLIPTADDIQEFAVDTSSSGADEGRATGGVINFVTKSGTNKLHWTAYDYFRNTDLNANTYFGKPAGLGRPVFNQNQWGFNLGLPVKKDKIFFFGSYENDQVVTSTPIFANMPTNGNAYSAGLPGGGSDIWDGIFTRQITDPSGNCPTITGTQLAPGNTSHNIVHDTTANTWSLGGGCWDPTSTILRTFYANQPNSTLPGTNFAESLPGGDNAPQMNARMDFDVSPKQRLFAHVAWWAPLDKPLIFFPHPNVTSALPNNAPWNFGSQVGGFNTNLYILGDTYTLNPKTVLDLRAEWVRFRFSKIVKQNNFNLGGLGPNWGALMYTEPAGAQYIPGVTFGAGSQVHNLLPQVGLPFTSATANSFGTTGSGQQWDNYGLNGSLTRVFGRHSVKFGFEARLMDMEVLATGFTPGNPTFGNKYSGEGCTGSNCGDEWADFMLGDFVTDTFGGSYGGAEFNWYQSYFAQDTWQVTQKLTLNLGVRYELPGGLYERKNHTLVFLPNATDPNSGAHGTEALVASTLSPSRSTTPVKFDDVDPRIGFAYRLGNNTVIRGGAGISQMAVDLDGGGNGAPGTVVTSSSLGWTNPTGTGVAPTTTLSNPIPSSAIYVPAQFRTNPAFLQTLAQAAQTGGGTSLAGNVLSERLPYFEEYNFAVQHQFGSGLQVTAAYVGSHGLELNAGTAVNQIPRSAYTVTGSGTSEVANSTAAVTTQAGTQAAGTNITSAIANNATIFTPNGQGGVVISLNQKGVYCTPGYSQSGNAAPTSGFCNANWKVGNALQPYPNYKNATISNQTYGNQHYNALQVTTTWRIRGGGLLGSAFTFAKTIGDNTNYQDYNNHRGDRTVEGIPSRLVINGSYPLPIGKGQKFLNGNGPASYLLSGWTINDITSFQHGGYLSITSNTQNTIQANFGGGTSRASYVPSANNCNSQKKVGGSAVSKIATASNPNATWFNTACFAGVNQSVVIGGVATVPLGPYDFGNETANDPQLFAQGIDNSDISLAKTTKVAEKYSLVFRMETFNTFNRFQASPPASLAAGNALFGKITTQANNPRQVQLSLRLNY